jgi:hypothetical protein
MLAVSFSIESREIAWCEKRDGNTCEFDEPARSGRMVEGRPAVKAGQVGRIAKLAARSISLSELVDEEPQGGAGTAEFTSGERASAEPAGTAARQAAFGDL